MAYFEAKVYSNPKPDDLAAGIFRAYKASKQALQPLREVVWRRAYLFYHSCHDLTMFSRTVAKYPFESAVFVPMPFQQVETSAPRLAAGVLANDPLARLRPIIVDGEQELEHQAMEWCRRTQALINTQLVEDVKIRRELPKWIRDAEIYGTTVLFVEWFSRTGHRWRQRRAGKGDEWDFKPQQVDGKNVKELIEDRIKVTAIPIWNFFPDPRARSLEDCRFVIRQEIMDVDRLWSWIEASKDAREWKITSKKQLEETVMGKVTGDDDWLKARQADVGRISTDQGTGWKPTHEDKRLVRVLDWYDDDWHIILLGSEKDFLIALKEKDKHPCKNAGKPFVLIRPTPLNNEIFGLGLIESIAGVAHQVNTLVNIRNVNLLRSLNNIILCNNLANIYAQRVMSQPAQAYDVDGSVPLDEAMKVVDWPDITGNVYLEVDYWHQQGQLTGGGSDFAQGQASRGFTETARGIGYMLEAGNARYQLKVHSIGEDLGELVRVMLAIDGQYVNKTRLVEIMGDDGAGVWLPIGPDMVSRDYRVKVDTRPAAANPSLEQQLFVNWLQIVGQWPELNRAEAILRAAKLFRQAEPRSLLQAQNTDAHLENDLFRKTGKMGPVSPSEPHGYHRKTHEQLAQDGTLGRLMSQGREDLVQEFMEHYTRHLEFEGLARAVPQAGGQGAEGQGAPPGGGGAAPPGAQQAGGGGGGMPPFPQAQGAPYGQ